MPSNGRNIIVIGTSAGGREALDALIGQLRGDLPASIFIVQHLAPENSEAALVQRLSRHRALRYKPARHGEGHSFTLNAVLDSQSERIDETLWICLRMFEERKKNLLKSTRGRFAVQRAKETQIHIDRIRAILLDPRSWQQTLERVKKSFSGTLKTESVRRQEERQQKVRRLSKTRRVSKRHRIE